MFAGCIDWANWGKALMLWSMNLLISVSPIIYAFFIQKYGGTGTDINFSEWIVVNSDVYFLILSVTIVSLIEHIITVKKINGILFSLNFFVIWLVAMFCATAQLQPDILKNMNNDFSLLKLLKVYCIASFILSMVNILLMNYRGKKSERQQYREKGIY